MRKKELSFEQALEALEEMVNNLENEQLSLNDSLAFFEKGIGLSRLCLNKLEEAEKKIEILLEKDGQAAPCPFTLEEKGD